MKLSSDLYQRALEFAARAHGEQRMPGSELPYLVHVVSVAMEVVAAALAGGAEPTGETPSEQPAEPFALDLAAVAALLHDTVEDTPVTIAEVEREFGGAVAQVVLALSKNAHLPKAEQMSDSLARIVGLPAELARAAAIVKLADRITNLQAPPSYWPPEKRAAYQAEAKGILAALAKVARWPELERRMVLRIKGYTEFLSGV